MNEVRDLLICLVVTFLLLFGAMKLWDSEENKAIEIQTQKAETNGCEHQWQTAGNRFYVYKICTKCDTKIIIK